MKAFLGNEYAGLMVRLFLGAVFVVASVEKIADPAAFAVSIENYRILSGTTALVIATGLPWIELLCGLALMFGLSVRGASLLTFGMLIVFTAAIVSALVRGLDISCGCFTQDPDVGKIGWTKVAENTGLLLLALYAGLSTGMQFTFEQLFRRGKDTSP
jgi:uncharacterized membrane protein YphA (DoxX/SURF4 family)